MSLTINVATRPAEKSVKCRFTGGLQGNLPQVFGLDDARLKAELGWVNGLLEGLASFPLDGQVSSFFREGAYGISGEVTVYTLEARDALIGHLNDVTWRLKALMALYPMANFRLAANYQVTGE